MKYIVEAMEGDRVKLEEMGSEKIMILSRTQLPKDVRVGDVLEKNEIGYSISQEETKVRKEMLKGLLNDLFE